jgi:hypothetical protein
MFGGNTKRIVVIKDIPSNLIEEAIFILRHEPAESKANKPMLDLVHKNRKKEADYLLKEAEMILNHYISDQKTEGGPNIITGIKLHTAKSKLTANTIINITLVGSIAFLIFIISRFI